MFAILERAGELVIAGNLTGNAVRDLEVVLRNAPQSITLELSELRMVDASGARCLREWQQQGGRLTGASRLVTLLLELEPESVQSTDLDHRSEVP